jgi:glycosyltransferase involved in cell wall biosynthesis
VSRPNTGYTVALNEAVGLARAEYLARMDADDVSLPQRLEKQVEFLDSHRDHVAVGCRVVLMDPDGDPIGEVQPIQSHEQIESSHLDHARTALPHPSVLMRAAAVRRVGCYRKDFEPAEDLDLFLRLAEVGKLAKLPDVLFHYRFHLSSVSHLRTKEQRAKAELAVREARRRRGIPEPGPGHAAPEAAPTHSEIIRWWVRLACRAGNYRTARKYVAAVLRERPFSPLSWRLFLGSTMGRAGRPLYRLLNRAGNS